MDPCELEDLFKARVVLDSIYIDDNLQGRGYVVLNDIKTIGRDVLRHRIVLTYEAEAENLTTDDILKKIFDTVEVP